MNDSSDIFKKVPEFSHDETMHETSPEEFDFIVRNRRSVRVYTNEKVPKEVVERVLEWGLLAPNSSNLQTWEFYWVQDPRVKSEVVEACFSQPAAKTAQEIIVAVAKLDKWKMIRGQMLSKFEESKAPASAVSYYKKLVPFVYTLGFLNSLGFIKKMLFSIVGIFRPVPREITSMGDLRVWASKSTALACENIMLGFSAYGYDTCPMEGYDSKRMRKALKLGSNAEIVMAISVGKRDKKGIYGPRIRMPKEQFIKIV